MQDYRKLLVWQKGHQLAIDTYALPRYFLKTRDVALLARDVKLLSNVIYVRLAEQVSEVRRMLNGFIETLR